MKKKILLVDDEVISTLYFGSYLRDLGHEVKTAANVESAIAIGAEFKPDILITDWMLKDKRDGIDVAEALCSGDASPQIIFITGMAAETLHEKVPTHLHCTIVEKPVSLERIVQLISDGSGSHP